MQDSMYVRSTKHTKKKQQKQKKKKNVHRQCCTHNALQHTQSQSAEYEAQSTAHSTKRKTRTRATHSTAQHSTAQHGTGHKLRTRSTQTIVSVSDFFSFSSSFFFSFFFVKFPRSLQLLCPTRLPSRVPAALSRSLSFSLLLRRCDPNAGSCVTLEMGACHSQRRDKDGGRPGSMAVVAKVEEGSPWQHYETVDTGISPRRSGLAASSSSSSTASGPGAVATQKTKPRSNDVLLQVFRVKEKETGVTAIARQIFLSPRRNSPEHTRKIVEEVMALSHPNIVQVQRAYLSECSVHLIMAHLRGAVRLSEYLAQLRAPSLGLLTSICKQIASAVNYLHSCGFVHAFLSPDSFMVLPVNTTGSAPAEGGGVKGGRSAQYAVATPPRVLLIDFGLEWKIGRNVGLFVALEHAPYTSPEVAKALTTLSLRNRAVGNATTASDVFSIGAIFFFVFTGRDLFEGPNTTAILDKVRVCLAVRVRAFFA